MEQRTAADDAQHPLPAWCIPSRRLQNGQKVWPDGHAHRRPRARNVSRSHPQTSKQCVLVYCILYIVYWLHSISHVEHNAAIPAWLLKGNVTQLVLVLLSKDTRTPLERWSFHVDLVAPLEDGSEPYVPPRFPPTTCNHLPLPQCTPKARGGNPKGDSPHYQAGRGLGDLPTAGVRADRVQHPCVHQGQCGRARARVARHGPDGH